MDSKPTVIFVLALLSIGASFASISNSVSQPAEQNQGPMFSFTVLLRHMEMQEIAADIKVEFWNIPYDLPTIPGVLIEQQLEYGGYEYYHFEIQPNGYRSFTGAQTVVFHPRGTSEFYPLDGYALNITFYMGLPHGLIDKTNTKCSVKCLIPGLEGYKESGAYEDRFDAIEESWKEEGLQQVTLNTSIYLRRGFSGQLVISVLFISFLLLGSLLLIKPDRLEQRLSACLTLFLFAISFTFTIQAPTALQARATFAETLTFMLLIGAGLLSVLSVIEKTLFEEKPRLVVLQYPIEGVVLVLLSLALHGQISNFIGMSGGYPWLHLSSTFIAFSAILITAILYGYVIKTVLFISRRN